MSISRRDFLRGALGLAATAAIAPGAAAELILPKTMTENAEDARRIWALDQTMMLGLPDTPLRTIPAHWNVLYFAAEPFGPYEEAMAYNTATGARIVVRIDYAARLANPSLMPLEAELTEHIYRYEERWRDTGVSMYDYAETEIRPDGISGSIRNFTHERSHKDQQLAYTNSVTEWEFSAEAVAYNQTLVPREAVFHD